MVNKAFRSNYSLIDWSDTPEWKPKPRREVARSDLSAPMVIGDTMKPVQSMLDGKMYDSKAALRQTYKEAGVTEVGNDIPPPPKKPGPDTEGIKAAVGRAFSQVGLGA